MIPVPVIEGLLVAGIEIAKAINQASSDKAIPTDSPEVDRLMKTYHEEMAAQADRFATMLAAEKARR